MRRQVAARGWCVKTNLCSLGGRSYISNAMKMLLLLPIILVLQTTFLHAQTLDSIRQLLREAPVISGDMLDGRDLEGRPVVLAFFASWCPPCRTEFKALNEVLKKADAPVTIIAVNLFEQEIVSGTTNVRLARFLKTTDPQFTVIEGGEAIAEALGGVHRIPNVFVFKSDGSLDFRFIHVINAQKMSISADELLKLLGKYADHAN